MRVRKRHVLVMKQSDERAVQQRLHCCTPQETAITRHLAAAGLVGPDHPATLVELGAGTGGLSKRVQRFAPGTPTVLIERETMKRRHDMYWSDLDGVSFHRAVIDIRQVVVEICGLHS